MPSSTSTTTPSRSSIRLALRHAVHDPETLNLAKTIRVYGHPPTGQIYTVRGGKGYMGAHPFRKIRTNAAYKKVDQDRLRHAKTLAHISHM